MIFEELTLNNFRQFAGEQSLKFATATDKNVTVIHGFNGAGKTTLLNAFTWLLYGELSPDFEAQEHLESEAGFAGLKPGGRLTVSVKARFTNDSKKYVAERTSTVEKDANGNRRVTEIGKLRLIYTDDEQPQESNNPQDTLERMLPKRLYPFFFFNGERIERLARADAYGEIGAGIRTLLGIELFDRAIQHSEGDLSRRLRQEITERAGDEGELAKTELDQLSSELEALTEKRRQLQRNGDALEEERNSIDGKLATMPELAKWLAERKAAEDKEAKLISDMKLRKSELAKEFSRSAYLLLVPDVLDQAKALLDGARQKGEIPGPIKRQFVEDLLSRGKCICDNDLVPDSVAYNNVAQWKMRALSDALESSLIVTQARIETYGPRADECMTKLQELQRIRDDLQTDLQHTREELSELSLKIGDRERGEDPQRLERRRKEIDDGIMAIRLDAQLLKKSIDERENDIRAKEREIENLQVADEEGKLAQRRLDAVSRVVNALKQIREIRYADIREDVSRILSEVWSRIAIKDYQARLDDQFQLQLTKDIGGQEAPVRGASTGEKQVLSLAFVGALSAKARSTYARSSPGTASNLMFSGGLYPLIIDSAFGNLEIEYRRDVAKWIPTLSPQIILLVSESQFRQEVAEELRPRIGMEWILKCETRKNTSRDITIEGRAYPYVVRATDEFERTTFEEVQL